jgi:hypothetical protein
MPTEAADMAGLTMRGHSAAWAIRLTLTGNQITGPADSTALTAAITKFPAVNEPRGIYAAGGEAAAGGGGDEVSAPLADGVSIVVDRVTRKMDGKTGADRNTATGGGGGGTASRLNFITLLTGVTYTISHAAMRGKLFLVCVPAPDAVAATEDGFHYGIGVMTSEVESAGVPETIGARTLEFTCGKSYDIHADVRTQLTGLATAVFPAITPISNTTDYTVAPIQPPALTTTDIDELITGEIITKVAA